MKVGLSKFCTLHPKCCVNATHSVCVCTTHQNSILQVNPLNWEVTYKDLVNKVVSDPSNFECMMYHCTNYPGTKALRKFLDGVLIDIDPYFQFHYSWWQTTYKASLVIVTSTCEEYKDISSSLCKMKSKVTIGVNNTAYYTQSLYILLMVMEIFSTILSFISDDNNHNTNVVCKIQAILADYLKGNLPIVDTIFYFSDDCVEQCKNCKTLLICAIISKISIWMLDGYSL